MALSGNTDSNGRTLRRDMRRVVINISEGEAHALWLAGMLVMYRECLILKHRNSRCESTVQWTGRKDTKRATAGYDR